MTDRSQQISLDPVKEGIVNRIAPGSCQSGTLRCAGGLLVEGRIEGDVEVEGMLVLAQCGEIMGNVRVRGERAVLAGKILASSSDVLSEVEISGVVELATSLVANANITAGAFEFYRGAQVDGRIRTSGA